MLTLAVTIPLKILPFGGLLYFNYVTFVDLPEYYSHHDDATTNFEVDTTIRELNERNKRENQIEVDGTDSSH